MRLTLIIVGGLLTVAKITAAQAPLKSALLDALPAAAPASSNASRDIYGWLRGSWRLEIIDYLADGTTHRGPGEWTFDWVLEGRALQDVLIAPPRGARSAAGVPGPFDRYGSSIRFYDKKLGAWRVVWMNPSKNYVATLVARNPTGGAEIIQEGTGDGGTQLKWTFYDITPTSFRWRGEASTDSGHTWRVVQEMVGHRTSDRAPLMEALLATGPNERYRERAMPFGQLTGSWVGNHAGRNPDGTWLRGEGEIIFGWVLEGRALQDVWIFPKRGIGHAEEPAGEYGTTMRMYDPSTDTWRTIFISPVNDVVAVYRARALRGELVVEGEPKPGRLQRWIFSQVKPTSFHWRNVISDDKGATWTLIEQVDARRVDGGRATSH